MITVISGTNRKGSNSLKIAKQLAGFYRELEAEAQVLDLQELPPEALDPGAYWEKPESVKPFIQQVMDSDGLVLVVPEYNGSFPGVLKLFIDLLPFPEAFDQRPACYIGISAGQFSGLRPVEQLQQVFGYRNAYNFPPRTFIAGVGKKIGEDGLLNDEELVERLKKQATGFLEFVRRINS